MAQDKTSIFMVAIVAIVGVVALFMMGTSQPAQPVQLQQPAQEEADNVGGKAFTTTTSSIDTTPTLKVQLDSSTVSPGETFTVDADIENVKDLASYQFNLVYDSSVLTPVGVQKGSFLDDGFFTYNINATRNSVAVAAFQTKGESGSGNLATIKFKASATGSSDLNFKDVVMGTTTGEKIKYETSGGVVYVFDEPTIDNGDSTGSGYTFE